MANLVLLPRLAEQSEIQVPVRETSHFVENDQHGIPNYNDFVKANWSQVLSLLLIAILISLILTIVVVKTINVKLCHSYALFVLILVIILLLIGNKFIKNIATYLLVTIIVTIILTLFILITYDLTQSGCRSI